MDAGRYADARESLLAAEEIFQHPSLSLRIAIAEAQMGRCADALARYSTLQNLLENRELPESVAAGLPGLGDSVDACDPRGQLQLTCEPDQPFVVTLDGMVHQLSPEGDLLWEEQVHDRAIHDIAVDPGRYDTFPDAWADQL